MSDNVAAEFPELEFVRPCTICPHMKKITLSNIVESLQKEQHEVLVDPEIGRRARSSVERMLEVGRGARG
jgi:quinolinate synthase